MQGPGERGEDHRSRPPYDHPARTDGELPEKLLGRLPDGVLADREGAFEPAHPEVAGVARQVNDGAGECRLPLLVVDEHGVERNAEMLRHPERDRPVEEGQSEALGEGCPSQLAPAP